MIVDDADLVRRYGGSVSGVLFDRKIEVFRAEGVDGVIPYRHGLGCAVAVGDPICSREDTPRLARAFRDECVRHHRHTVYVVASEPFARWATSEGYAALEFGRELIVDPRRDPLAGHAQQALRGKVHRAIRAGVVAAEYAPNGARDEELERAIERAVAVWLSARHGPQAYLTPFLPFAGRACKRWFYARAGGGIVGVMQLLRLDAYGGYLLSQLVSTPDAPPGTTELLGVTALRALCASGCAWATWGPAPLPELGAVTGFGARSERVCRFLFRNAGRTFGLEARNVYHRKFPVAETVGSYLLFNPPRIGAGDVIELLHAFHAA